MSKTRKVLGLWIVFVLYAIVLPVLYYLLSRIADSRLGISPFSLLNTNRLLAAFAALIGLFWVTWAYSYLHFVGRGSPVEAFGKALDPTRMLVTTGPYAYTRNPMLLGLLFVLLAIALLAGSLSGLVMIPFWSALALLYIRRFEEPELVHRFGKAYIEYRKSTRVLIPRLR